MIKYNENKRKIMMKNKELKKGHLLSDNNNEELTNSKFDEENSIHK